MTKQTPGSLLMAIAGGAGFAAFVALMVVGGINVSPAAFFAIVVALAAGTTLFLGVHRDSDPRARPERAPVPADRSFEDRTVAPGSAGVTSAGVAHEATGTTGGASADFSARSGDTPSSAAMAPGPETAGHQAGAVLTPETGGRPASEAPRAEESDNASEAAATDRAAAPEGGAERGGLKVRSGTLLEGEQEPAASKGSQSDARTGSGDSAESVAAEDLTVEPGSVEPSVDETQEPEAVSPIGVAPPRLSAPREGGPDDLTRIKGIGPKLEEMLDRMGFYHYDQIAGWSDHEAAWVDENLEGFKGRVARDAWVDQARRLAAGEPVDSSGDDQKDAPT